jgi:hypothetical protein
VNIDGKAGDLLRQALQDTTPDPERDAAGRDYFGSVYLAPGEDPPAGIGGFDSSFRQIASVAFRGGWHAARQADGRCPCGGDHGADAHDSAQALDEDDDRRTER